MAPGAAAFASASGGLCASSFRGDALTTSAKCKANSRSRQDAAIGMKLSYVADVYISKSVMRDLKQSGCAFGVYTVQCTEGTSKQSSADAKRIRSLSTEFRKRQATASDKYKDLFETRRAALINASGMHFAELSAVNFPAAAAARVLAGAEANRACDRYFEPSGLAEEFMRRAVMNQYTEGCCDGTARQEAEVARVEVLATQYRAGMFTVREKFEMAYESIKRAMKEGHGCDYEERQWDMFPKMAAAMKKGRGLYAASVGGAAAAGGISTDASGKLMSISERLQGVNASAIWPSGVGRVGITRKRAPWFNPVVKDYSAMSQAALQYGIEAQKDAFQPSAYIGQWSPGWQPKSSIGPAV